MNNSKEQVQDPNALQYKQAEEQINQAIASMSSNGHIEYGSTMVRSNKSASRWKRLLQWARCQFK